MERQLRAIVAQNQMLATRLSALENLVVTARIPPDWVSDPAPDGGGFGGVIGGGGIVWGGGLGPVADPAPEELGKLGKLQIESRLADIAHMRAKLDSVEELLQKEMKRF